MAASPADAASEVVLTVLPDLPDVERLLHGTGGLLAGWKAAGIASPVLVIHGTVSPVAVAAFAADCLQTHGVTVIDAPLSGGTIGAEEGRLSTMVGGPRGVVDRLTPLFRLYSSTRRLVRRHRRGLDRQGLQPDRRGRNRDRPVGGHGAGEASGLDLEQVQSVLAGGLANSEVLRQKGQRWIDADFEGGGSAKNQLKDLRFISEVAAQAGLTLPVAGSLLTAFQAMISAGLGDLDHTGIYLSIRG